ncbi:MAG: beta-galactosidase [Limisphaerales bacterium]
MEPVPSLNTFSCKELLETRAEAGQRPSMRIPNLHLLVCAGLLFCGALRAPALTVRVDAGGGAPRLLVNGEPVRSRMFWGAPGSAPVPVKTEPRVVSFEFTATESSAGKGTMHFRFGETPGDVFLDDIRVTDLGEQRDVIPLCDFESGPGSFARSWTFWPTGPQNTVGSVQVEPGAGRSGSAALRVRLVTPPGGHRPDFHVFHQVNLTIQKGHRYLASFWARSDSPRNLTVAFYRPGSPFTWLGGPGGVFESQVKLAAGAGVNFVSFPIEMPWPKPGTAVDWTNVDAACGSVLQMNPDALLLPRMGMDPPLWWREANTNDVMQWEDGRRAAAVPASPRYRHDAAERLAALVAHLEEKFGEHMAGYHPCGQNTGEWFYHDTWKRPLNGYAPADLTAWREWLKKRYRSQEALRRAWGKADAGFDTVSVPTATQRHASPAGTFRDPGTEKPLLDWAEFQQEAMADCVCELARSARQASRGRKLVVFFYGYVFEFAPVGNGASTAGHYALRRALDCPDIDVLCSPISYFDRGLGQGAPSMTAAESVALAGKLWLNEDDTHTHLATGTPPGSRDHVGTLEESNAELVRNVAQEAIRNFGTWWMDLGATGWFNDPGLWAAMSRLRAIDEPLLKKPLPFRPEIAAVIDERAMQRITPAGSVVTRLGVYEARAALGRMGAPYGQYLIDDVASGRVPAKMFVFLNAWSLTATERTQLLKATRGSARVWCYTPGYFDGDTVSTGAMRELTGFELKPASVAKAWATPTEAGRKLGLTRAWGVANAVKPLFAAVASGDEVLATYPDGTPAVAMRRGASGASVFVGVPGLTSELLRAAARAGGSHLFAETDCNVYANDLFLALHASEEGTITLNTGRAGAVSDVFTGTEIGRGPGISLRLRRGETRVLRY